MPLYVYKCDTCSYKFERQQSFSDDPIKVCPECSEPAVRRLITPVGVVFKGSGFYITDNRKSTGNGKEDSKSSTASESSSTASDSKSKQGESSTAQS
jgi:putative FmdB family regulatory protein